MLAVPHLDVLWIGPMDLSQALGVTGQAHHPKVVAAMDDIIARCQKAGVAVGTIAADAPTTQDLLRRGVQLIGLSSDRAMIVNAGERFLKEIRG